MAISDDLKKKMKKAQGGYASASGSMSVSMSTGESESESGSESASDIDAPAAQMKGGKVNPLKMWAKAQPK